MEYFLKHNIINEPIFFHKGVRDDPNINVFKCSDTNALILDKITNQHYDEKGLSYWNCDNINLARNKTYDDDNRRYNQLQNINYNSLLDIGCGNGGLLKIIKDKDNKNIMGIELNNELVHYLNKEGIII